MLKALYKILIISPILVLTTAISPSRAEALASGSAVFNTTVLDLSPQEIVSAAKDVQNTAANVASKYGTFMTVNKETFLDSIAYQLSRAMIKQMRDGMIRWIQSGYQGKPSFLVNPAQLLRNMAVQQAQMAISDIASTTLYSANRLSNALIYDIRKTQINAEAQLRAKITPTLSTTIQNDVCTAEGFGLVMRQYGWSDAQARQMRRYLCESGALSKEDQAKLLNDCFRSSFKCGGWAAYLDQTQNSERNTTLGQFLTASNDVKQKVEVKNAEKQKEADRNGGFLNMKECVRYDDVYVNGRVDTVCTEEKTVSPGQKAVSLMGELVTDPIKQARLTDEINESVNAVASAFMSDLVSRGFRVVDDAVQDLNNVVADTNNSLNQSVNNSYNNLQSAMQAFTKPAGANSIAPAYNQTNLQVIKLEPSTLASLVRNILIDMNTTASSNVQYLRLAQKQYDLLTPYLVSLNALEICNAKLSTSTFLDIKTKNYIYLTDRYTKLEGVLPGLRNDLDNIPSGLESLLAAIKFVATSTDGNAIQAVYEAYNQELDAGPLKRVEATDQAEFKYQEYDMQINGPRDQDGNPIAGATGDLDANLNPKLTRCQTLTGTTLQGSQHNTSVDTNTTSTGSDGTGGVGGGSGTDGNSVGVGSADGSAY